MPGKLPFQTSVFFLTFTIYFLRTVLQKTPSFVQSSLIQEWTPAPGHPGPACAHQPLFSDTRSAAQFMGYLNAAFLFANAFGIVASGMAADRLDRRVFLAVGMMLAALVMFVFGPGIEWAGGGYSKPGYMGLQVVSSLCQSTAWPCVLSVMTSWFEERSRGYLLGIWTSSSSVGSIVGALVVSSVVGYGYEYAFLLTTSMLFAGAVLIFFGLVTSPQEVGFDLPCAADDDGDDDDQHKEIETACDDGDSYNLEVDYGAHSYREDTKLLEDPVYNSGSRYASYGSSGHVRVHKHAAPAKFSDQRSGDNHQEDDDSTTTVSGNVSLLSHVSTHKSWIFPGKARSISANYTTTHNEDPYTAASDSSETENQYNKQELSGMKYQCHSDLDRSLQDHTNPADQTVHSQENDAGIRHTNKLFRDKNCLRSRSENNVRNSLTLPMQQQDNSHKDSQKSADSKQKAISFRRALLLPGVIPYSLCAAFLKLTIFVFYFWLPYYLTSTHGWTESEADRLSLWYDVGGMVGATLFTFIASRLNKRALVIVCMLAASVPLLYGYGVLGWGQDAATNGFLLFCFGSLLSGANNPLSATVSADLSQQEVQVKSVATVAGILDGFGIIGAVVGQLAVPYLFPVFGWDSVFYLLMLMVGLAALCLCPLLCSEVKTAARFWRGG